MQSKIAVAFAPADLGLVWATVKSPRALEEYAREILMQRIGGVVAILLILGLAAVGLIYAQKNTAASSSAVMASGSTAESNSLAVAAASQRTPVSAVSEPHAEAIRVAEATSTAPISPNTPAPNTSAQNKSSSIPPCDKAGGIGLSRIVEIDTTGGPGFGFEHFKHMTSCATRKSF
jgi:hypothetical protein